MSNLANLKAELEAASVAFDDACKPHYCDGRWGAYRAAEFAEDIPASVWSAMNAYTNACNAYYLSRDGSGGFLGGQA
jgi:hypothetical protein